MESNGAAADVALSALGQPSGDMILAPTAGTRGPVEGTLTGVGDAVGSVSLALTGNGLVPAEPLASAPEVDFEGVVLGQAAQRSAIVGNRGDEAWALAGARLEPPGAEGFTLVSSDCGDTTLSSTQTCEVQLEFRPGRVGADLPRQYPARSGRCSAA